MERADPDGRVAGEPFDAAAHFVGGLVRERQREHVLPRDALLQQPGHAMRHHAGLPAPRPGQNQQRPFEVCNRFPLHW